MKETTIRQLLEINRQFYERFGAAFAATRRRIQPGIAHVLSEVQPSGDWLDIGCGSGTLAGWWQEHVPQASYTGLDFSAALLAEARLLPEADRATFLQADLLDPDWPSTLPAKKYDGLMAFAVLHHLSGRLTRERVLAQVSALLPSGATFIHSVWQFQHSPKLLRRVQPWSLAGIDESELEPGDTLLDWRHGLTDDAKQPGLRYVHLFDRAELAALAENAGFNVVGEFESDGQGGRLALYQVWQKR